MDPELPLLRRSLEQSLGDCNASIDSAVEYVGKIRRHEMFQTRTAHGEYHHLFPVLKRYPDKFKQYVRMLPSTFQYILSKIEKGLEKNWTNFHTQPIMAEERLVVTLRFVATGQSYRSLSFSFRIPDSTICDIIHETIDVVWKILQPHHMRPPTVDDFQEIADDFYLRWDFPHCLGSIDCRHFRLKKPAHSKSEYYNYKKYPSIKLQAVVDANYKFRIIDVGDPGHNHDATTFTYSSFCSALKQGLLQLPKPDPLPNDPFILPYFFIGDGAYMLMENLMKPYRDVDLTNHQKNFNKRLSRARSVVECAFGILCQRWRIFFTTMQQEPATVISIIKFTCLLQNIIIDLEKHFDFESKDVIATGRSVFDNDNSECNDIVGLGVEVRSVLTKYLWKNKIE